MATGTSPFFRVILPSRGGKKVVSRRGRGEGGRGKEERRGQTAVCHGARRTKKKTGKTSSLKLKEAEIGILLPKFSCVVPAGAVSKPDCPPPFLSRRWIVSMADSPSNRQNSWMFIRKLRGRKIQAGTRADRLSQIRSPCLNESTSGLRRVSA